MFMILINEVIKKCLFIQFKCHDLEFVVSNLLCMTCASLGTCVLCTQWLSRQGLMTKLHEACGPAPGVCCKG